MRGVSLGSVRARVERLASVWPTAREPTFVCWELSSERCPSCAADLEAYAQATALATAVEGRPPGDLPRPWCSMRPTS